LKLMLYSLATVALVGLGSIMPFSRSQGGAISTPQACERLVYVDSDALARLHPAWRALSEMEATLAEVGTASGGVSPHVGAKSASWSGVDDVRPRVDRRELESEIRDDAGSALVQQEQEMRRGVWLRSQSARENMLARSEQELAPKVREIEASTAAILKALDEKYAPDDLNARIKVGALRAIAKSPAVDAGAAKLKLENAEGALARVEAASDGDKQRVVHAANARIATMRDAEIARVDRWVEDYQVSENHRIENSIVAARDRLCRDLGPRDYQVRLREVRAVSVGRDVALGAGSAGPGAGDVDALRSAAVSLRRQIALDVERTISELGRRKGVKVTLRQDHSGVPDETKLFAASMQGGEWSTTGPVLCLARGQ